MRNVLLALSSVFAFACSGAPVPAEPSPEPGSPDEGEPAPGANAGATSAPDAGSAGDGAPGAHTGPGAEAQARAAIAASAAARSEPACSAIATTGLPVGFYWEIGDKARVLASGARGAFAEGTVRPVASATKMMAAAYLAERLPSLDAAAGSHLRFTSGYAATVQTCRDDATVADCYAAFGGDASYEASKVGRFYYGPAHLQKLALGLPDLGAMDSAALASDVRATLRLSSPVAFKYPALAGGLEVAPVTFREFLQKLLRGDYKLRDELGKDPACTRGCPGETSSPLPDPWHYGAGHWIEDACGQGTCDGAFSALGAFGFYAWIDATRTYYGIVGHWELPRTGAASMTSALCGQKIRAAFVAAVSRG